MRTFFALLLVVLITGCAPSSDEREVIVLSGKTMGTTYHVKAVKNDRSISPSNLKRAVEASLREVNMNMSNWVKTSEVEQFNASISTAWQPISQDLGNVLQEGFRIHEESGGRFDVTLAPLIDLWGFGPSADRPITPSDEEINLALDSVGMNTMLEFEANPPALRKVNPATTINLSAIAKGYGVDKVAGTLEQGGFDEYLVEIGGDLITKGKNEKNIPWVIGIEKPDSALRSVQHIIKLKDQALATSGDYRNYKEVDGKRLAHILDVVTGRPIDHKLASVTVVAGTAARADGLATAIFAMGEVKGLKLAEKMDIPAFFIIRGDEKFIFKASSAFKKLEEQNGQ